MLTRMYQIEAKRHLVAHLFRPDEGWQVTVHLDPMELATGGTQPVGKKAIATDASQWLREQGVALAKQDIYGPADLVAAHPTRGTVVVEVENDTRRQREQALYSAFGQVVTTMRGLADGISFGLAFPDAPEWERQARKLPTEVCRRLMLSIWLVSPSSVRCITDEMTAGN